MNGLLAHKKHLVIITSILAILGLMMSLFADTAGGIATNHNQHASTVVHGAVGTAAGGDAVNTGFRASTLAADFVQPSSANSTSPTTTNDQTPPSSQPTSPGDSDGNDDSDSHQMPAPAPAPTPPAQPPCQCPTPKFPGEGTMIACPDNCISPTPVCPPCGGFREAQTNDAIMCPMMMCAE